MPWAARTPTRPLSLCDGLRKRHINIRGRVPPPIQHAYSTCHFLFLPADRLRRCFSHVSPRSTVGSSGVMWVPTSSRTPLCSPAHQPTTAHYAGCARKSFFCERVVGCQIFVSALLLQQQLPGHEDAIIWGIRYFEGRFPTHEAFPTVKKISGISNKMGTGNLVRTAEQPSSQPK